MKKLFAMLLAVVMILSLATVGFAAEEEAMVSEAVTLKEVYKAYNVIGATTDDIFPAETLEFEVTADSNNPADTVITVDPLEVDGADKQELTINVPSYDTVGLYKYTIKEIAGNTQGVNYTDDVVAVVVLVTYNYEEGKLDAKVGVEFPANANAKFDTFTNTYEVGKLTVNKTVSGNLADQSVEFEMTVTFKAAGPVLSDIIVTASEGESIIEKGWTEHTETIYVKHGETVTFDNIPAGVTYEVVEAAKHGVGEDGFDVNSATDTDYSVVYEGKSGTISSEAACEASVVNTKTTDVATGIVLDSMPYVLILAVACFGMFTMLNKKRYEV